MRSLLLVLASLIVGLGETARADPSPVWAEGDALVSAKNLSPRLVTPPRPPFRCWLGPIEDPTPYGCALRFPTRPIPTCASFPVVGAFPLSFRCRPIK